MNPSTAQAEAIIEALIRFGTVDVVLAPGSRSAPLAFAVARAEREGRIRLHVRTDERSAGFLALGLAKASGRPVPVVVTSGTAVANLHPAVVEASYAAVPLLVLSADRPGVLRDVGAPQTIDQVKIFGNAVRWFVDVAEAHDPSRDLTYWRSIASRAATIATNPQDPGPVHLNLPFAEPLVPSIEPDDEAVADPPLGSADPWFSPFAGPGADIALADLLAGLGFAAIPERGLVVVGDIPDAGHDIGPKAAYLADACNWPIIAEPSSQMHRARTWLPHGSLLAGSADWADRHTPDLVVSVGRVGLTRQVTRLLGRAKVHICVDVTARWSDPGRTADAVLIGSMPQPPHRPTDAMGRTASVESAWLQAWQDAEQRIVPVVESVVGADEWLTGLQVAETVWRTADDRALLYLGASWPIRMTYLTALPRRGLRVLSNRGANGIDGVVSSAYGAAVAHEREVGGPTLALIGDLTLLHDLNGLNIPAIEPRPPLTYVVIDNNGGGIFSQLEQAAPAYEQDFERIFGTPHGLNITGLSRLMGVPGRAVETRSELLDALSQRPPGVSVVVAQVQPRADEAQQLRDLQAAVDAALG